MWSVAVHDTQSGAFLANVDPASGSWGRGSVAEREHVFPLRGNGMSRATNRSLFQKWQRTIVQRWNGAPVYAGLISDTSYDRDTGMLSVKHTDLRTVLSKRMLFGVGSYNPAGTVVCTSLSRRGIARRLLYLGFVYPFSAAWPLPVNLPAEESGSINRTFYYYDFQTVDQLLTDLQGESSGPDVELQPKYTSGVLSWDALIGSPYLSGPSYDMHLAGDLPPVGVTVAENGQKQATGVFALGRGSEQDMRVGSDALPVSAGLSKDFAVPHKDVDDVARLNSLASADVAALSSPTVQWSMRVNTSVVSPGTLRVGSTVRTFSQGDEWIADGWTSHRVIGFDGDFSDWLTLDLEVQ